MNLRDIKYLVAVAELGHFGKAALACNVSQPTLSMQLKKLEDTLGVSLFERTNRKVMITEVGRAVVEKARQVLAASEQMVALAKLGADPFAGEITLGVFPTLAPYVLPLVMSSMRKALPKLSVNLLEEKTAVLLDLLAAGKLDAALIALPVVKQGIIANEVFKESFYLAVATDHPLAKRGKVQIADLEGETLLLLDEGHCLREQALDVCQRIGAQESQRFRATSLETLRQMVAAGSAMTLMPKLAIRKESGVVYLPIVKPPMRHIALCYRATSPRIKLMEKLAVIIKTATEKHL